MHACVCGDMRVYAVLETYQESRVRAHGDGDDHPGGLEKTVLEKIKGELLVMRWDHGENTLVRAYVVENTLVCAYVVGNTLVRACFQHLLPSLFVFVL